MVILYTTYHEIESGAICSGGGSAGRQHNGRWQQRFLARVVAIARPLGPVTTDAASTPLSQVSTGCTVPGTVAPARQHLFELFPEVLVQPRV